MALEHNLAEWFVFCSFHHFSVILNIYRPRIISIHDIAIFTYNHNFSAGHLGLGGEERRSNCFVQWHRSRLAEADGFLCHKVLGFDGLHYIEADIYLKRK